MGEFLFSVVDKTENPSTSNGTMPMPKSADWEEPPGTGTVGLGKPGRGIVRRWTERSDAAPGPAPRHRWAALAPGATSGTAGAGTSTGTTGPGPTTGMAGCRAKAGLMTCPSSPSDRMKLPSAHSA